MIEDYLLFLFWLEFKGALDGFEQGVQTRNFREYPGTADSQDFVLCAFRWDKAPGGPSYWRPLNTEWRRRHHDDK